MDCLRRLVRDSQEALAAGSAAETPEPEDGLVAQMRAIIGVAECLLEEPGCDAVYRRVQALVGPLIRDRHGLEYCSELAEVAEGTRTVDEGDFSFEENGIHPLLLVIAEVLVLQLQIFGAEAEICPQETRGVSLAWDWSDHATVGLSGFEQCHTTKELPLIIAATTMPGTPTFNFERYRDHPAYEVCLRVTLPLLPSLVVSLYDLELARLTGA